MEGLPKNQAQPKHGAHHTSLDAILASGETVTRSKTSPDDYQVRIPNFEGPLDLLLHLIRKEQINIYDIPVARICKRYFEHLELMQQLDVDIAGEFMVMASTLILIKSAVLLPQESSDDEEEDPRMPLVAQLLEYERYKLAAKEIDQREWLHREVYPRPATAIQTLIPKEALADAPVETIDSYRMLLCLKAAIDRTNKPPMEITAQHVSLKETVATLGKTLLETEVVEFLSLIPFTEPSSRIRAIVMQFLAMLELARLRFVEILQTENCGPIQLRRVRSIEELDMELLDQY